MMYKVFLYTILTIIYLGLAKALSPSELGVHYLQNERSFHKLIKGHQTTAILIDTHATGFLIKTYYQKYRVISGYDTVEEFIVRTSREFAKKNLQNIGLSIYRKTESKEEFLPLPPGSTYVGNHEFGEWRINKKGIMKWRFNKAFKNFPRYLGWGKFRPDINFFQQMKSHSGMNQQYLGENNEFGPAGYITQENFPHFFRDERKRKIDMKSLLVQYFKENF